LNSTYSTEYPASLKKRAALSWGEKCFEEELIEKSFNGKTL
jgi:hypothetical protein